MSKVSSNSAEMKGLHAFISDIRACRSREMEEKRINRELGHIRQKFKDVSLSGYDRKKYVCKLLYMYILGYRIDFGYVEAANLLNSSKYKEKCMGYLAVALLFNENSDTIHLVINSFKKDLDIESDLVNSLVLSSIANIGGSTLAETLGPYIVKKLIAPSSPFVKKKAALCLLKLYRKSPGSFELHEWPERLINLINDSDLGVVTAAASLIHALCNDNPSAWNGVVPKCIERLSHMVLIRSFETNDTYYKVPAPWLQIKLLRILQLFEVPSVPEEMNMILGVLQSMVKTSADQPKVQQQANAQNAIFFEAIRLAIHWRLNPNAGFLLEASKVLVRFLTAKDLNARYLTLDIYALMLNTGIKLPGLSEQEDAVISACRDRDISVRQQALDVLYRMATDSNGPGIVTELLRILKTSDALMKEVLVLRIAILVEKFSSSFEWYFRTMFEVLVEASTFASDDVWHRIVQRFSVLPSHSTQDLLLMVYNHMVEPACPERLLQLCVYLIGERGDALCSNNSVRSISPADIFQSIHGHFAYSSNQTKCMILTAYIKLVNLFPEIRPLVEMVLSTHMQDLDMELQERAWEYLVLLRESDQVLMTVCEQMPPYSDQGLTLESRLTEREQRKRQPSNSVSVTSVRVARQSLDSQQSAIVSGNPNPANQNIFDLMEEPSEKTVPTDTLLQERSLVPFFLGPSGGSTGVLYSDAIIEIGAIVDYSGKGGMGFVNIFVYFGNRTIQDFDGLTVSIENPTEISVQVSEPSKTVGSGQQERMGILCAFRDATAIPIIMRVKYSITSSPPRSIEHAFRLPAWVLYFGDTIHANPEQFMNQWTRCEKLSHISHVDSADHELSAEWLRNMLQKFKWGIVDQGQTGPLTIRAAAKFSFAPPAGPMFALVEASFNHNLKSCHIQVRSFPQRALAIAVSDVLEYLICNSTTQ